MYMVVPLNLESVDKILKCDSSTESYQAVLSYGSEQGEQGGSHF